MDKGHHRKHTVQGRGKPYPEVQAEEVVDDKDGAPLLGRLWRRTVLGSAFERLLQERGQQLLVHRREHTHTDTEQRPTRKTDSDRDR